MVSDDLYFLSTSLNESDIDNDILAYEVADIHSVVDHNAEEKIEPFTLQNFSVAEKKCANCCVLTKNDQCIQ